MLCSYDILEQGLEKLTFYDFSKQCGPFEEEVVSRLANICPRLSHLQLNTMYDLTEAGRLSLASLFRQIIQQNPPIEVLNMESFSEDNDVNENIGELILEALLTSRIDSIVDLNLRANSSWFKHPGNVDLLAKVIFKQSGIKHINLSKNEFSSDATHKILTKIADNTSTTSKLSTLNLGYANFETNETVEKLADIL